MPHFISVILLSLFPVAGLGMESQHLSIRQIITEVQKQKNLSLEKTETILNQKLIEATELSNEYFQMYKGTPLQLAGGTVITNIDLRLPRAPSGNPGLLSLNLEGECITLPQVKQQFPVLEITGTPRGDTWEDATTYTANTAWGEVDFGFHEKKPECVGYIVFHPKK